MGVAGSGMVATALGAAAGEEAATADAAMAGTGRGPGTVAGRGWGGGATDEKMLLRATAALAADAGLGAGAPLGLSRCFTRAIRSCGWKGLRKSSSALTRKARSATARLTTPDIRITGVFDNVAWLLMCWQTSYPSFPGMITSVITISGLDFSISPRALAASWQATTLIFSRRKVILITSRMVALSSMK